MCIIDEARLHRYGTRADRVSPVGVTLCPLNENELITHLCGWN